MKFPRLIDVDEWLNFEHNILTVAGSNGSNFVCTQCALAPLDLRATRISKISRQGEWKVSVGPVSPVSKKAVLEG